jgi:outer membrane protein assembly factor BamB
VNLTRNRLAGVDAGTGRLLWSLPFTTPYEQNAVTPLVIGDLVVYGGIDHPVRAVRIAKRGGDWKPEAAWANEEVSTYMSSPVAHGGRVFGFSMKRKGQLFALDAATGRTIWLAEGRQGDNASLAVVGGALVALTTEGELLVVDAAAPTFRTLHRSTVATAATWAHVGVTGDGLLIKDETHLTSLRF